MSAVLPAVNLALRIGSRGSKLALWQAEWVKARLEERGATCRIEIIKTTGDKILDVPLARIGGKGLFTKEIEEALLDGRIDLAVHSLKDLPTELPEGLTVASIPQREDPRDALVGATLGGLARGARVGTSSLRRAAQLRVLRPDLAILDVRGNVDTRLRKQQEGQYDALIMASAGLTRLGLAEHIAAYLDPAEFLPAVAQGALAIETRDDGGAAWAACRALQDSRASAEVTAERALLAGLGGGCQTPLGALATARGSLLELRAVIVSPGGDRVIRKEATGAIEEAALLGESVAKQFLASEARAIIEAAEAAPLGLDRD
ncbi:MAG: hydroxymethylbilane synthase [Bryobacterales bacterium]|nr:hydroxymethylbilane synthase [Bryobacterales bacterium]